MKVPRLDWPCNCYADWQWVDQGQDSSVSALAKGSVGLGALCMREVDACNHITVALSVFNVRYVAF